MNFFKMNFLIPAIFLMNLVDAFLTYYEISNELAAERNPLMDFLLKIDPLYFFACKIVLVTLGLWLLKRLGDRTDAILALRVCAGVYAAIIGMHLHILL